MRDANDSDRRGPLVPRRRGYSALQRRHPPTAALLAWVVVNVAGGAALGLIAGVTAGWVWQVAAVLVAAIVVQVLAVYVSFSAYWTADHAG